MQVPLECSCDREMGGGRGDGVGGTGMLHKKQGLMGVADDLKHSRCTCI